MIISICHVILSAAKNLVGEYVYGRLSAMSFYGAIVNRDVSISLLVNKLPHAELAPDCDAPTSPAAPRSLNSAYALSFRALARNLVRLFPPSCPMSCRSQLLCYVQNDTMLLLNGGR